MEIEREIIQRLEQRIRDLEAQIHTGKRKEREDDVEFFGSHPFDDETESRPFKRNRIDVTTDLSSHPTLPVEMMMAVISKLHPAEALRMRATSRLFEQSIYATLNIRSVTTDYRWITTTWTGAFNGLIKTRDTPSRVITPPPVGTLRVVSISPSPSLKAIYCTRLNDPDATAVFLLNDSNFNNINSLVAVSYPYLPQNVNTLATTATHFKSFTTGKKLRSLTVTPIVEGIFTISAHLLASDQTWETSPRIMIYSLVDRGYGVVEVVEQDFTKWVQQLPHKNLLPELSNPSVWTHFQSFMDSALRYSLSLAQSSQSMKLLATGNSPGVGYSIVGRVSNAGQQTHLFTVLLTRSAVYGTYFSIQRTPTLESLAYLAAPFSILILDLRDKDKNAKKRRYLWWYTHDTLRPLITMEHSTKDVRDEEEMSEDLPAMTSLTPTSAFLFNRILVLAHPHDVPFSNRLYFLDVANPHYPLVAYTPQAPYSSQPPRKRFVYGFGDSLAMIQFENKDRYFPVRESINTLERAYVHNLITGETHNVDLMSMHTEVTTIKKARSLVILSPSENLAWGWMSRQRSITDLPQIREERSQYFNTYPF